MQITNWECSKDSWPSVHELNKTLQQNFKEKFAL